MQYISDGRLDNRMHELRGTHVVDALEHLAGRTLPAEMAARVKSGADELALVRSGLDDTMCRAYREIREVWRTRKEVPDLRTAAFVVAIQKVARCYMEMGV